MLPRVNQPPRVREGADKVELQTGRGEESGAPAYDDSALTSLIVDPPDQAESPEGCKE